MKTEFTINGGKIEVKENLIDKTVRFFNPIKANNRFRARANYAVAGAYIGARSDRRQTKQWRTRTGDADSDTLGDLKALRDRSSDLIRNHPVATGICNTEVGNVVGRGLQLQSRINRDILDMTDEEAEAWEKRTEFEFSLWSDSKDCDISRTLPFIDQQSLALRQVFEKGDVFILLPRIPDYGQPYSLKTQFIEAERVSNENNKPDSPFLASGIEKDERGAPTIYHISNFHPGSSYAVQKKWEKISTFSNNTGLRNILHLFNVLRPGQTRGVPRLAPVVETLKQLSQLSEAELMASVISAMLTIFIKRPESPDGDFEGPSMIPLNQEAREAQDTDIKLAAGAAWELGAGESIDQVNPMRPNTNYEAFFFSFIKIIAMALDIPYEVLTKHFTASFSASRAALMDAWRFFRMRREWLARNFCQEIYELWLYEAIALGRISAPGFFADPLIHKAYCGSLWKGDAPMQIDPVKEIVAAEKRIANLITTVDEETTAISGGDFETNLPRIRKEVKVFADLGLKHPAMTDQKTPATTASDAQPPDNTGDLETVKSALSSIEAKIEKIHSDNGKHLTIENQPQDINLNIELKQDGKTIKQTSVAKRQDDGTITMETIKEEVLNG